VAFGSDPAPGVSKRCEYKPADVDYSYPGGIARAVTLAQGKVNEMDPGIYKICFATKHSAGDAQQDFKALSVDFEILPASAEGVRLVAPSMIPMGGDIVVHWEANIGFSSHVSQPGAWIGLYKKGDCDSRSAANRDTRNHCYLSFRFLPDGSAKGHVRFTVNDYKATGEFEARYFRGDSINGQGQACTGTRGVTETYTQCTFDAVFTSSAISVPGGIVSAEEVSASTDTAQLEIVMDNSKLDKFRRETF
jgi:hypothetical protein